MNKHLIRVIVICIVAVTALVLVSCKDTRSLSFDNDTYIIYLDTAPSLKPGVSVKPAKNGYTLSVRNDTIAKVESDGQTLKGLSEGITVLTAVSGEKQATATLIVYAVTPSDPTPSDPEHDGKFVVEFITEVGAIPNQYIEPNGYATRPEDPSRPGYRIYAWYTDAELKNAFDFSTPINGDLRLYAGWGEAEAEFEYGNIEIDGTTYYGITGLKTPHVRYNELSIPQTDPEGTEIRAIGPRAFADMPALETVTISSNLRYIDQYAFVNCTKLTTVTFPHSSIGSGVTTIGEGAFGNCQSLTSINLPSSLRTVGSEAFAKCYALKSIALPSSLKTIPSQAFAYSGLESVDLTHVTSIGMRAFWGALDLASITAPTALARLESEAFRFTAWLNKAAPSGGNVAYLGTTLVYCYPASHIDVIVRSDTTLIANQAFYGNTAKTPTWEQIKSDKYTEPTLERTLQYGFIRLPATPVPRGDYAFQTEKDAIKPDLVVAETAIAAYAESSYYGKSATPEIMDRVYYSRTLNNLSVLLRATTPPAEGFANRYNLIIERYRGSAETLDVKSMLETDFGLGKYYTVTRIHQGAFTSLPSLKQITLPHRIGLIDSFAFNALTALEKIFIRWETLENDDWSVKSGQLADNCFSISGANAASWKIFVPTARLNSYRNFWTRVPGTITRFQPYD